ncbi:MAG: YeeE/YedE family protein [Pseudobdellovibrionaceae bacterium]
MVCISKATSYHEVMNDFMMAAAGGALVGLAMSALLLLNGRVTSVSGIFNGLLQFYRGDVDWRVYYVLGLILSGVAFSQFTEGSFFQFDENRSLIVISVGGLLAGFGAALGTGCLTGHTLSAGSLLSQRGLIATGVFLIAGIVTAIVMKRLSL